MAEDRLLGALEREGMLEVQRTCEAGPLHQWVDALGVMSGPSVEEVVSAAFM